MNADLISFQDSVNFSCHSSLVSLCICLPCISKAPQVLWVTWKSELLHFYDMSYKGELFPYLNALNNTFSHFVLLSCLKFMENKLLHQYIILILLRHCEVTAKWMKDTDCDVLVGSVYHLQHQVGSCWLEWCGLVIDCDNSFVSDCRAVGACVLALLARLRGIEKKGNFGPLTSDREFQSLTVTKSLSPHGLQPRLRVINRRPFRLIL